MLESTVMPSPSDALNSFSAVVLTGGSSGIGKSFIKLGSRLSPHLVFCNLSRREPERKNSEISSSILNHFSCDLSRPDALAETVPEVVQFLEREVPAGRILLINNSGFGAFGAFPEPNLHRQLEMIDVNVRAVVELTGLLLPLLRKRGGVIMNIASTIAYQPSAYASTYGATKAFVLHWTLALNEELRGTNLRALAVCPGTTKTEFFQTAGLGQGAVLESFSMTTDAVVMSAFQALGRGRAQVVPGWMNKLYTFFGARLPKPFVARISGKILRQRSSPPPQP
jgi:short-subunit dehydrogenase